jgi:hypothetical protein
LSGQHRRHCFYHFLLSDRLSKRNLHWLCSFADHGEHENVRETIASPWPSLDVVRGRLRAMGNCNREETHVLEFEIFGAWTNASQKTLSCHSESCQLRLTLDRLRFFHVIFCCRKPSNARLGFWFHGYRLLLIGRLVYWDSVNLTVSDHYINDVMDDRGFMDSKQVNFFHLLVLVELLVRNSKVWALAGILLKPHKNHRFMPVWNPPGKKNSCDRQQLVLPVAELIGLQLRLLGQFRYCFPSRKAARASRVLSAGMYMPRATH